MNSLNHYAYGSVVEAIYLFKNCWIKKFKSWMEKSFNSTSFKLSLRKINFEYNSINGKFKISWYFGEEQFYMNVTIPMELKQT